MPFSGISLKPFGMVVATVHVLQRARAGDRGRQRQCGEQRRARSGLVMDSSRVCGNGAEASSFPSVPRSSGTPKVGGRFPSGRAAVHAPEMAVEVHDTLAPCRKKAEVIRGPWPALRAGGDPRACRVPREAPVREAPDPIAAGKMMLGFVVRECTVALGRAPTRPSSPMGQSPAGRPRRFCLFGRAITAAEAHVILAHPDARPVRPERIVE